MQAPEVQELLHKNLQQRPGNKMDNNVTQLTCNVTSHVHDPTTAVMVTEAQQLREFTTTDRLHKSFLSIMLEAWPEDPRCLNSEGNRAIDMSTIEILLKLTPWGKIFKQIQAFGK